MKITIIAVGKLKERFWENACDEYLKRLRAYATMEIRELPDIDPHRVGGEMQARERESTAILQVMESFPPKTHTVLLAIEGAPRSSEQIAAHLEELRLDGTSDFAFIIGGSCGVDDRVAARVQERLSFGAITLPHNLARVVLLEQLYRAFKIIKHEPYHK